MAIHVGNEETERLIRELALVTEAATVAVRERLARVRRMGNIARIEAIIGDASKRFRPPYDAIDHGDLLYDEVAGLPRRGHDDGHQHQERGS